MPWRLIGVSADARELEITHVFPKCTTEAEDAVVREDSRSVTIRIPEVTIGGLGEEVSCDSSQTVGMESIRLAAPLGRRTLRDEPGASRDPAVEAPYVPVPPDDAECVQLDGLAPDAPARDVPWVIERLELCASKP